MNLHKLPERENFFMRIWYNRRL